MSNAVLVFSALSMLVACAPPHRSFTPPPATLTPDQRVAAFHALRAVSQQTVITTSCSRGGGCSSSQ